MRNLKRPFVWILLSAGAVLFFMPFVWMTLGFCKTSAELTTYPPSILPNNWSLANVYRLFYVVPFGMFYLNSIIVSIVSTFAVLLTSSVAGYIFSKKRFFGREIIFVGILSLLMIPFSIKMIPLFMFIIKLGLINMLLAVILPNLVHPFGVFLMKQHIETIPTELIEAALIDGASELWVYIRIILPLSKSTLAALAIFIFLFNFNDYLWPLIVLQEQVKMTLSVGITTLHWENWTSYDLIVTAATLAILPPLLVFLVAQKQIIKGLTLTGLKS